MSSPLIGVTTYGIDGEGDYRLPSLYIECIRRAGGSPLLIPPGETHLEEILAAVSGIVLAGGGDIDPKHYHGIQHETVYGINAERDLSEIRLARYLLIKQIPTLAICRGTQIINIALGGTLIEDLPSEIGTHTVHRLLPRKSIEHDIEIASGSKLASIIKQNKITAASWHHQAIRKVAENFAVVATAPDGTIEAIESDMHPELVAIQWHPELTASRDPIQQLLFDELISSIESINSQKRRI